MTKRRDVVKALALAPFAAFAWSKEEMDLAAANAERFPLTQQTLKFFTPVEWKNMTVLVDDIIPKDERGASASEAKVPEFMDFILSDGNAGNRTNMRAGLEWLEKESQQRFKMSYANATAADRNKILDDIAWPAKATDAFKVPLTGALTPVTWFTSVRNLTAGGYFSSRMGYKAIGFTGGVSNPKWMGSSPEIMKKLGLSYDDWDKKYGRGY
jgi:gluconate 2-dehydrogenase subunit 3-like protein